ncbi:peptidase S8/S53 domain-containing protein [Syncephalis fuscata]|nr:peptidase S8/S53 domain-containing protein [Syncephalis fuscata]
MTRARLCKNSKIARNYFTTLFTMLVSVIINFVLITGLIGHGADVTAQQLPAPSAEIARNITALINTTLTAHPELKQLAGPARERIITFKERPGASDLEKFGIGLLKLPEMNMVVGMIPDIVVEQLEKLGIVDSVAESKEVRTWDVEQKSITMQPITAQWNLPLNNRFDYPSSAGENVDIYVLDTGIDVSNAEFGGRARWGGTFMEGKEITEIDEAGHGTMVASLIGGRSLGVAKAANIIARYNGRYAAALSWVWAQYDSKKSPRGKPLLSNMSIGSNYDKALNNVVVGLIKKGITVIAAAGNGDQEGQAEDSCFFSPGSTEGVITVGATDIVDRAANFSNFGRCVNINAPGVDVLARQAASNLSVTTSGTSFAAPIVSGVVALMMAEAGPLTPDEVTRRLLNGATQDRISSLGPDTPNRLLYSNLDYSPISAWRTNITFALFVSFLSFYVII